MGLGFWGVRVLGFRGSPYYPPLHPPRLKPN